MTLPEKDSPIAILTKLLERSEAREEKLTALFEKVLNPAPPPDPKPGDELVPLHVARRGGPPKDVRSIKRWITLVDSGKAGSGDVIASDVPCDLRVVYDAKSPGGRIVEATTDDAPAIAYYEAVWNVANPAFVREATESAEHQTRLVIERGKFVREALWWRLRMPIMRALVGRDLAQVTHLVRLEPAADAAE